MESLSESNQRQNRMAGNAKHPVRLRSEPADGVASRRTHRGVRSGLWVTRLAGTLTNSETIE